MTIEEKFKKLLFDSGMCEDEAEAVIEMVKDASSVKQAMRWGDPVEGYPAPLYELLWVEVKRAALKYIDANCPQAWFRPMFTQEVI